MRFRGRKRRKIRYKRLIIVVIVVDVFIVVNEEIVFDQLMILRNHRRIFYIVGQVLNFY